MVSLTSNCPAAEAPRAVFWKAVLLLVLLAGALLRLARLDYAQYRMDDATMLMLAQDALNGRTIPIRGWVSSIGVPHGPVGVWLDMVPVLVSTDPIVIAAFHALLNVAAIALTYRLVGERFGRRVGLLAAALFAANPWLVVYSRRGWEDALIPPLTVAFLWATLGLIERRGAVYWVCSFAFLGLLAGTHLSGLVHIVTLAVLLVIYRPPIRLPYLLAGLALFGLIFFPYLFSAVLPSAKVLLSANTSGGLLLGQWPTFWWLASLSVSSVGYQAIAGQSGRVVDVSQGPIAALDTLMGILLIAGILFALILASQRRSGVQRRQQPYLALAVSVTVPLLLLAVSPIPPQPYLLLVTYPASLAVVALLLARASQRIGPLAVTPAVSAAVVQVGLALVFFQFVPEYWPGSDYGIPLRYSRQILEASRRLAAQGQRPPVLLAGSGDEVSVLHSLLARSGFDVRTFDDRSTRIQPAAGDGPALVITTDDTTPLAQALRKSSVQADELTLPGSGRTFRFFWPDPGVLAALVAAEKPLAANLEDVVRIEGFTSPSQVRPGTPLPLSLQWQVAKKEPGDWRFSAQLVDEKGRRWAQSDFIDYLTQDWQAGTTVLSTWNIPVPPYVPPLPLLVRVSMYRSEDGRRLAVLDGKGNPAGLSVDLTRVEVGSSPGSANVPPPIQERLDTDVGGSLRLLGISLDSQRVKVGSSVGLLLFWQVKEETRDAPTIRMVLTDGEGKIVAHKESLFLGGRAAPGSLYPGRVVAEDWVLTPDGRASPGWAELTLEAAGRRISLGGVSLTSRPRSFTLPDVQRPVSFRLGNVATLIGYDLSPESPLPGGKLDLTLYWLAAGASERSYKVFTHLVDAQGSLTGQHDGIPQQAESPSTSWVEGEVIKDRHQLPIRPGAAGRYFLKVGLYDEMSGERLSVSGPDGLLGDSIALAAVQVTP